MPLTRCVARRRPAPQLLRVVLRRELGRLSARDRLYPSDRAHFCSYALLDEACHLSRLLMRTGMGLGILLRNSKGSTRNCGRRRPTALPRLSASHTAIGNSCHRIVARSRNTRLVLAPTLF